MPTQPQRHLNPIPCPYYADGKLVKTLERGKYLTVASVHNPVFTHEANTETAAFIAAACNAHAALLEALQRLSAASAEYAQFMASKNGLAWAQYLGEMQRLDANVQEALQQARAAIAAATGEGN